MRICQTKFQLSIHFRSRGYPAPRKTQMPAIEKVLYLYYFFELFVTSLKAELFKPFKPLQRNNLINPYIIRSFRLIRVLYDYKTIRVFVLIVQTLSLREVVI